MIESRWVLQCRLDATHGQVMQLTKVRLWGDDDGDDGSGFRDARAHAAVEGSWYGGVLRKTFSWWTAMTILLGRVHALVCELRANGEFQPEPSMSPQAPGISQLRYHPSADGLTPKKRPMCDLSADERPVEF